MRVFHSIEQLPEFKYTVFTQGTFDGVHLGHQQILNQLTREAERLNGESLVLTFWPHPRLFLFPDDNNLRLLQTLDEKLELFAQCHVDNVVVLPFTKELSNVLPEDYIKEFLVNRLNVKLAIVGYDHRFGRNREGDISVLRQFSDTYAYKVEEIKAEDIDEITISSTKIRNALSEGDIANATKYLGRPYSFKGTVVKGMQLGRTLGFPTANLVVEDNFKLIPAIGVYAVKCTIKGIEYGGMMNIGNNPTIPGKNFSIEVNIFDFDQDIYNEVIEIHFISWLRNEKKFENLDDLASNLLLDRVNALNSIKNL
ncbi:MAG: bifunctional riboflavin kinase/FAD synthetase [Bacteroidia bacterium]|nr:bifunctional riboflavin kinase/FAD synthetase [Bacteroidia bacterium]